MLNHEGKGVFITFEGGEGVGKSTQIRLLSVAFEKSGIYNSLFTREPGATEIPLCQKLRKIVKNDDMDSTTEMLIFFADRNEHVKCSILPALKSGKIVVSDRFYDFTRAYQRATYNLDNIKKIEVLIDTFINDCTPDLTILLDADPEEVLHRSVEKGKFENKDIGFHQAVRNVYLEIANEYSDRIKIIKDGQDIYNKHISVIQCINDNLGFKISTLSQQDVINIINND